MPEVVKARRGALFVYGLLMQGFRYNALLARGRYLGKARTSGRLVSLGAYPGLLDGDGAVHGELYAFDDVDAVFEITDPIEGFDPADPDGSMYVRTLRLVYVSDAEDEPVPAWIYVYNGAFDEASPIPEGDWSKWSDSP